MICMSVDMICISKRAINFHPSISIKANDFVRQGRKTKKLKRLKKKFKLENMSVFRTDWYFNGPCYLKSKLSPQKEIIEYMSFHLIESSVLKVTKVKLSSLM